MGGQISQSLHISIRGAQNKGEIKWSGRGESKKEKCKIYFELKGWPHILRERAEERMGGEATAVAGGSLVVLEKKAVGEVVGQERGLGLS